MILETERLYLRKLTPADRAALCETLQDKEAMYAYEHAFSDEEADAWLARQIARYQEDGFGLWAVIRKEDEAARACKQCAFETLGLPAVYSIIRENNLPSRRVAERNGMRVVGTLVKHYYGFAMPHLVYRIEK